MIEKESNRSKSTKSNKSIQFNKSNGNLLKPDVCCLNINLEDSQDENYDKINQNLMKKSLNKKEINWASNNNMKKSSSELNLFNKLRSGIIGSTMSNKPKNLSKDQVQNNANNIKNGNDKVSHEMHIKQLKSFQIKI